MRMVPAATPVCSATSLIASFFTGFRMAYGRAPDRDSRCETRVARSSMILVTGATGYVGSQLVDALLERGERVRTLSRRGAGKGEARKGDVLSAQGLPEALEGVETAYYLVHSMGGGGGDFAAKDRTAAVNFGVAAEDAGVKRVVYLGGLG